MEIDRKKFIGGTDLAAILGISEYKTELEVWMEKMGYLSAKEENLQMKLGKKLEKTVSELFMEQTKKKVRKIAGGIVFHKKYNYIAAQPDYKIEGENALLECKTTSIASKWGDDNIPIDYLYQCYQQLIVTGYTKVYIAVLINNRDFKIKKIVRDDNFLNELIQKEVEWWDKHVIKKEMPMNFSAKDYDLLKLLYPEAKLKEKFYIDNLEINEKIKELKNLEQQQKIINENILKIKAEIEAVMGEKEIGETENYIITWKQQVSPGVNFDFENFKKNHPELYEKYKTTKMTRILRIKEKGDKNE